MADSPVGTGKGLAFHNAGVRRLETQDLDLSDAKYVASSICNFLYFK